MKLKIHLVLYFFCLGSQLFAQSLLSDSANRVYWLNNNAIKVSSIDPAQTDFFDLQALKKWIGDAQVVSIEEPAHQIGSVLSAKTRLITFLHQQLGFDLVITENGMYEQSRIWEHIKSGNNPRETYKKNVFFGNYKEIAFLFDYVNSTIHSAKPLEIAGFDPQLMGAFSADSLILDLRRYFSTIGYSSDLLIDTAEFVKELFLTHARGGYKTNKTDFVLKELTFFIRVIDSLSPKPLSKDGSFLKQVLRSTKKHVEAVHLSQSMKMLTGEDFDCAASLHVSLRDRQMAENLLWYVNQYPKRKIIVLAHNTHLIKEYPGNRAKQRWNDDPNAPPPPKGLCEETYMGYIIADSLKEKLFNIAMTVGEGNVGYVMLKDTTKNFTWFVPKSKKQDVLENQLDAAGFENAIVNLKSPGKGGEWLKEFIRVRYYTGPGSKYQWSKAADAIFYVRKATPLHADE